MRKSGVTYSRIKLLSIIAPAVCAVALVLTSATFIIVPEFHSHLVEKKKDTVRFQVETVHSLMAEYHKRVVMGELTLAESQRRALMRIKNLRYGADRRDYFWINDMKPRMIMHPYFRQLDGLDLKDYADVEGKKLFVEMVRIAGQQGQGFVEYHWQWQDRSDLIKKKISFVKLFEPWGWIIGTGMYFDDIERDIARTMARLIRFTLAILAIIIFIAAYLVWTTVKIEIKRKSMEERLINNELRLRTILEKANEMIYTVNEKGVITLASPAWKKILGYDPSEITGRALLDFIHPDDREDFTGFLNRERSCEDGHEIREHRMLDHGGSWKWQSTTAGMACDENERLRYFVCISQDISESMKARQELAMARQNAEEALRVKGDFLARMSHEIRTPMNVISGMAELLGDTALDDTQQGYIGAIRESSEHLLSLVNDILDYSRLEAGKIFIHKTIFSIRELCRSLYRTFSIQVERKGLTLYIEVDDALPEFIISDPMRIRQILVIHLDNASKYPDHGAIVVRSSGMEAAALRPDNSPRLFIEIHDSGIGIPEDKVPVIFNSFEQVDTSYTRKKGGAGLGLAISKEIVSLMGGLITVASSQGSGSEFSIVIPVEFSGAGSPWRLREHRKPDQANDTIAPLAIIIAEDNAVNAMVLRRILEKEGHAISLASNGLEVIELLKKGRYDLVIMDIEMPLMDGIEATMRIRTSKAGNEGSDVPIIALTAHVHSEVYTKSMAAGMNAFITKPVNTRQLQAVISNVIREKT
jgi:PAS domain S-box-containing protein